MHKTIATTLAIAFFATLVAVPTSSAAATAESLAPASICQYLPKWPGCPR